MPTVDFKVLEDIQDIFEKFFPKNTNISMGTFARKAVYLMLRLAEYTKDSWKSYTYYRQTSGRCETVLSSDNHGYIVIKHAYTNGNLRNVTNIVDSIFAKDRWVKRPFTYAKLKLETNLYRSFLCEKTKFVKPENSIGITLLFRFNISNITKQSIPNRLKSFFRRKPDAVAVDTGEVISSTTDSQMPDELMIDVLRAISSKADSN